MTTPPVRVERRVGQRFSHHLPVALRECSSDIQGAAFTQDLSSRGVFLFTDAALAEGSEVELTLRMPSEITLGEDMRVRCKGRVLRIVKSSVGAGQNGAGRESCAPKLGVAIRFDSYEYLPDITDSSARTTRATALHTREDETTPVERGSTRAAQG